MIAELTALSIPSPGQGVWHIGGVPIRAYALAIILGVVAAVWFGERRWEARGGRNGQIGDVALWAVPAGLIGARIYHVATDHDLYFGSGKNAWDAFAIWHGGLGIWGAIAGGAFGAWLACRHYGLKMLPLMDALAPGLLLAQAIGRWGNYFNQELFGRPTTLPWALQIAPQYRPPGYEQFATFHPTFLYEMLWDLTAAVILVWLDRRFRLGHGKVFALYVLLYTAGRFWIEALRIDTVNEIGGFRLNNYTALIGFLVALVWLIWLIRNRPGREEVVEGIGLPPAESVEENDFPETASTDDGLETDNSSDSESANSPSTRDSTATP